MSYSEVNQYGYSTKPSRFFDDIKEVNIEEI